jgi:hypothetical protein
MKQLEEKKSQTVTETVKRIVTKDKEGHVIKYLARRIL